MTLKELLPQVLPLAIKWATDGETMINQKGRELSLAETNDARTVGVREVSKIRIAVVPHIPIPGDGLLHFVNEQVNLITPNTAGLTLRYGIFIKSGFEHDRRLLLHEFVQVAQYEEFGGTQEFLLEYLSQCVTYGYPQAPLEIEADRISRRITGM